MDVCIHRSSLLEAEVGRVLILRVHVVSQPRCKQRPFHHFWDASAPPSKVWPTTAIVAWQVLAAREQVLVVLDRAYQGDWSAASRHSVGCLDPILNSSTTTCPADSGFL